MRDKEVIKQDVKRREYFKEWRDKNKEQLRKISKDKNEKFRSKYRIGEKRFKSPNGKRQSYRYAHIKAKYGLDADRYEAMIEEQNNKCYICNNEFEDYKDKRIHADHCHTTGKVRGLLCGYCNKGLGFFGDNIERLERAIQYMKQQQ